MTTLPQLRTVMPALTVAEMERSVRFYEEVLGFAVTFRNGDNFTIVRRGAVELGLLLDRAAAKAGKSGCYVKLVGVDAIHAEFRGKGVGMTHELRTESYGMREFMITDPDGNTINFGEPAG